MPATVLTSQYYDAVRGLIAPDVTAEHISDAYLSQDPFAPDAEREVRKRLSAMGIDVDTLTGEPLEVARLGMIHQCVSELCVVAAQILQQDQIEIVTRVQEINWKEKRAFILRRSPRRSRMSLKALRHRTARRQKGRGGEFSVCDGGDREARSRGAEVSIPARYYL